MTIWLAHFYLFLTSLIGAFNFSISKMIMPEYITPGAFIVSRGISSALFFFIADALFVKGKISFKEDGIRIALCALTGIVINQLCFYEGLAITSPIHASLIIAAIPVTVFIVALISKRESFTLLKSAGLLLGLTGVSLLIIGTASGSQSNASINGDMLVMINSISYGIFMVIVTPLMIKYPAMTVVKWLFTLGIFVTIPYGWNEFAQTDWSAFTLKAWMAFAFVIILATWLAYYLNTIVLRMVSPSVAGIYIYIQPVMAILIAVSLGQDHFDLNKTIYSLMILSGVWMVSRKSI
jgi:drug/metabolite transporter (DMT)-like permease